MTSIPSKHNPLFRNAAKAFLDKGWPANALLPGIPIGATMLPASHVKTGSIGKVPGEWLGTMWKGMEGAWASKGLAGATVGQGRAKQPLDTAAIDTWPTDQVCIAGYEVCGLDIDGGRDVVDLVLPIFEAWAGEDVASARKRDDGSARCMAPFRPAGGPGSIPSSSVTFVRGAERVLIEIKGKGYHWTGAGGHPEGCSYMWTAGVPSYAALPALDVETVSLMRQAIIKAMEGAGWVLSTQHVSGGGKEQSVLNARCLISPATASKVMAGAENNLNWDDAVGILAALRGAMGSEGAVPPDGVYEWAMKHPGSSHDWLDRRWHSLEVVRSGVGGLVKWLNNPTKGNRPDLAALIDGEADLTRTLGVLEVDEEAAAEPGEQGLVWREVYAETEKPKPTWWNCRTAIKHLRLKCSFNVFRREMLIGRSDASSPTEPLLPFLGVVADATIVGLRVHLSKRFDLDFTEKHVRDAVISLAFENKFDPVLDLLAEAQANWDGKARIDRFAPDYLNSEDTELNRQFGRKTLIAMATRARQPGCKFDTMPVTESAEGWNKSSVWPVLAGDDNFSDQRTIGLDPREVMEQLGGVWVHENADLAGLRKTEVETVKGYMSRRTDKARAAYGHLPETLGRRWIEVGTTNAGENNEYLLSQTGNRRFWPIKVLKPIDLDKVSKARLQLLGEAAYYESKGESLVLPEHLWAAAGEEQEKRRVKHPFEEELHSRLMYRETGVMANMPYWGPGKTELRITTQALFRVLEIAPERQEAHARQLANAMRAIGWEPTRWFGIGRGYRLPADKVIYAPGEERDEDGRQR